MPSPFEEFEDKLEPARQSEIARREIYVHPSETETPASPAPDPSLLDYYGPLLWRWKWTILSFALLGALTAFLLTKTKLPLYRASTLVEIQNLNEDFLNMRAVLPTAPTGEPEYNVRTQVDVLLSRPVLERAVSSKDFETRLLRAQSRKRSLLGSFVKRRSKQEAPAHERALSMAEGSLRAHTEPNTRIIEVTFDSTDPRLAADFVNAVVASYADLSLESRWQSSQNTTLWLSKQVQDVKAKLETAEDSLQKFASKSKLTILSDKDNAAEERLRQTQEQLSKAQADRIATQSLYELAVKAPPESLPDVANDATLKDYQVELTTLQRQQAELSSIYAPGNPKMKSLRAQIATMTAALENRRAEIVSRIHNDYTAAERREQLLKSEFSSEAAAMGEEASQVAHYSMLQHEVDATRQLYDLMVQRVKEASLAAAMQASGVRVIDAAVPPGNPYSPNVPLNTAVGLLVGLCLAAGFAIQRTRFLRGIRDAAYITRQLDVPGLGIIPASPPGSLSRRLLGKVGMPRTARGDRLEIATWQQWSSEISESFRLVLTSILLSEKAGARAQVIALTSAFPGEGKTTVLSNLGIALAQIGRRVLLIDGDIRKPRLHEIFEVDNCSGLTEALGRCLSPDVKETAIPNLFLLPSGQGGGETLLFTPRLRQLIRQLRTHYSMVLIDTPPLLMSDARLLGHQADAVILVVAQQTGLESVLQAQQRLAGDGTRVLGTILNNWKFKNSNPSYREYSSYYKSRKYREQDASRSRGLS